MNKNDKKMILVDYKRGMDLSDVKAYGVVLNSYEYSLNPIDSFNSDEILLLNKKVKENGFKTLLNIDQIIKEEELDGFIEYFNKTFDEFDYILFSDMCVLSLTSDYSKLIYYPKTLVSSIYEVNELKALGIEAIISNELSIEEIKEIDKECSYSVEAFGFHQMFYSRRKLLSLYRDYAKLDFKEEDESYFIKEEIRDDYYPIYEFSKGTLIYTDYCYYLLDELKELENVNFIYLNGLFFDLDDYVKIVNIYSDLISNKENLNKDELFKMNYKFSKGFLNKKSVLLKEGEDDA